MGSAASAILSHLFLAYLVAVLPWLGRARYRWLKQRIEAGDEQARLRFYQLVLAAQLGMVLVVLAIWRLGALTPAAFGFAAPVHSDRDDHRPGGVSGLYRRLEPRASPQGRPPAGASAQNGRAAAPRLHRGAPSVRRGRRRRRDRRRAGLSRIPALLFRRVSARPWRACCGAGFLRGLRPRPSVPGRSRSGPHRCDRPLHGGPLRSQWQPAGADGGPRGARSPASGDRHAGAPA